MKKFFVTMLVAVSALSIAVTEAQAKRLGGGGSSGRQSQSVSRQAQQPMQNQASPAAQKSATAPATPAAAPKPSSPWKSILGGALLGLGLGALFSHLGLGGAMASMLSTVLMIGLLALAAMFIYRMIRNRNGRAGLQPSFAGASNAYPGSDFGAQNAAPQATAFQGMSATGGYGGEQAPWGIPADFDTAGFLRHAKTYFIRLQAAWDKADIDDLREFTSPEMFAELKLQIQERGASANHTDVLSLEATLLGMEMTDRDTLASVKFSGMIKEAANAPTEPFAEVWNLSKPTNGQGGWILAGIQQLS